jgi:hypothetical protein
VRSADNTALLPPLPESPLGPDAPTDKKTLRFEIRWIEKGTGRLQCIFHVWEMSGGGKLFAKSVVKYPPFIALLCRFSFPTNNCFQSWENLKKVFRLKYGQVLVFKLLKWKKCLVTHPRNVGIDQLLDIV